MGRLIGEQEKARRLIAGAREKIRAIRARIPKNQNPPRILTLVRGGWVTGSHTSHDALIRLAGGENVAAERGIRGARRISAERAIAWNPDVLMVGVNPESGESMKSAIRTNGVYAPLRDKKIVEIPYPRFFERIPIHRRWTGRSGERALPVRKYALTAMLIALALLLAALSVRLGVTDIASEKIIEVILSELGFLSAEGAGVSAHERAIIWHIRLPRTLTGAFVGASLALSGVMLQGLFRNPMASPRRHRCQHGRRAGRYERHRLGIRSRFHLGRSPERLRGRACDGGSRLPWWPPHKGHTPLGALILCGMAMNSIAGALTTLVLSYSVSDFEIARQILFWLMGSLTNRTWEHVFLVAALLRRLGGRRRLLRTRTEPHDVWGGILRWRSA